MPALKRWTIILSILDVIFLLAGIFVIVISFIWKGMLSRPVPLNGEVFLRLAVSELILDAGIVFAGGVFMTVLISLWPLTTKPTKDNEATKPVVIYIGSLLITSLITMSIGTTIWFYTLREKAEFLPVWQAQSSTTQVFIQDTLSCCGWFNATTEGLFDSNLQTGFCQDPSSLPVNVDPNVHIGCEQGFIKKVDYILNNIFSTIYGFMVIQFLMLLAAATVGNLRIQEKRFLRIDYKSLGHKGGFV